MFRLDQIIRPNIKALQSYSSARNEYMGKSGVFLDANENPFGELNRYPDPNQRELKEKLAQKKGISIDRIFIGNGSDEVIDLVFRIFCRPNEDKALTFSPTYGMYDVSAQINEVQLIQVPLNPSFQIEIETVKPYLNDAHLKLIFICSPNNPTGNLLQEADVLYLLENFKGLVILDEAYIDFAQKESFIQKLGDFQNLLICQTFSKAYGLAAARIGIAYSSAEIIALFNRVKPPYNVSELNQNAAIQVLSNSDSIEDNISRILEEKKQLIKQLLQLKIVRKIYPSDSNFLLVELVDADKIYAELLAQEIITRNRNKQIPNCLRITIGSPEENRKLIKALKK